MYSSLHACTTRLSLLLLTIALPLACGDGNAPPPDDSAVVDDAALSTNRVAVPSTVRRNLGITFVTVERRKVEETLRFPGRFEYQPSAQRSVTTMLPGRITLLIEQFARVETGTPLYRLDSSAWRDHQKNIANAQATTNEMQATLASMAPLHEAHQRHADTLQISIDTWANRLATLESIRAAGGGQSGDLAFAQASLASAQTDLAEVREQDAVLEATATTTQARLNAARENVALLLESAAAILGTTVAQLTEITNGASGEAPRWRTISSIQVNATMNGVVASIDATDGAWLDAHERVLELVQPERLRFHAEGLQSDLGVLRTGQRVRIVPPRATTSAGAIQLTDTMGGVLELGLIGDAERRTVNLYVTPESLATWARPGVAAQLEVVVGDSGTTELAVPLGAIQHDGLDRVIFRRSPDNPNEAIRLDADLGRDDGRWIEVLSGLRDGDEVVLDGGFQLMLATSGSRQAGGHFHADGTFHEEAH